ncbi:uncharacterized protein LOC141700272, partial [Apium graveolens]|uniref:uncharacterized protein LOC141700272 n=1 Tax=Apium graveolens TaxID=4045 RepID=UPI003D7B0497
MVHLGADKVKKAKAQTLKAEFESLVMKDTEQLDDFCMKMNSLVTNIRMLGEKVDETYVVKKLLRAVPVKFLQIASAIEQFGDLEKMSVEEVVGSLKAHEERIRGQNEVNNGHLMLTEEEWSRREGTETKLLFTRDEWLKRANKGGNGGNGDYRKDGRMFRDRSRPRRDREQRAEANLTQITDDEPALLVAEFDKIDNSRGTKLNTEEDNTWYLDNGASSHMTGHRGKFKDLDETVMGQVKFGDGSM